MDKNLKKITRFLYYLLIDISNDCVEELINTPKEELYKYHFTLGMFIRNRLYEDKRLLKAYRNYYKKDNPDELSLLIIKDLQEFYKEVNVFFNRS